jgi:hypothetical protein
MSSLKSELYKYFITDILNIIIEYFVDEIELNKIESCFNEYNSLQYQWEVIIEKKSLKLIKIGKHTIN